VDSVETVEEEAFAEVVSVGFLQHLLGCHNPARMEFETGEDIQEYAENRDQRLDLALIVEDVQEAALPRIECQYNSNQYE